jgi:hypothetical protein
VLAVTENTGTAIPISIVINEKGIIMAYHIGFDIETGGHVFQLHMTNSTGMTERTFINETTGEWGKGNIRFGFNVSRVFTVRKPKEFRNKAAL